MREIRALIVDDEPLARRGIRQLLDREPDVTVIGEARNGRDALRALRTLNPDLVFLDVQMPEIDGFEVLRAHGAERMPAPSVGSSPAVSGKFRRRSSACRASTRPSSGGASACASPR